MDDMWNVAGRVRPVPLDYESIMDDTFTTPPVRMPTSAVAAPTANGSINGSTKPSTNGDGPSSSAPGSVLKDQLELSVKDNLELFMDRLVLHVDPGPRSEGLSC